MAPFITYAVAFQVSGNYKKGGPFSCLIHSYVTTLGGSKECTVYFPVPGIEDNHCRILKTDSGFVIIDNQSTTVSADSHLRATAAIAVAAVANAANAANVNTQRARF